ncbi:hypothetical protein SAMN05428975_1439 [Mucilaginibacter sp. OK268]|uniref:YncE family protein n=1 Tax=Mucilaginibacter sp. OK268 TaxID=1881048 RepID=UPI00088DB9AA|nr:hypothetical protein [Mucilaginibacter sp. OK268]SDP49028.1 hypothetical protein SAMN05428975_1439 [Mucilaginibacter sp. OK268]
MGTMFKTGSQLLGINGSIYKFSTSKGNIITPLNPQPPNTVNDICIDVDNSRLFVCPRGTGGQVWVYDTITLTRTNIISGFSNPIHIRMDPNPVNDRLTVFDFNNSALMFIDRTSLALSGTTVSTDSIGRGLEYDQNLGRNQLLAIISSTTLAILNATTFAVIQQIVDPQFGDLGKAKRNAHNPDEIYVCTNGGNKVVVMNMVDLTYSFKTISGGAFDIDADPNLPNNRIYTTSGGGAVYTASDFGFIENLNFLNGQVVVADPTIANHRLFFGNTGQLYVATLA